MFKIPDMKKFSPNQFTPKFNLNFPKKIPSTKDLKGDSGEFHFLDGSYYMG